MKSEVESILMAIETDLRNTKVESSGLLTGQAGAALFYSELFNFTNEERYLDICLELVSNAVEGLGREGTTYGLCNGFAGVGWVVERLMKDGLIERSEELFDNIENKLYQVGSGEIRNGRYDFLHAAGGVALLALSRLPRQDAKDFLVYFVNQLDLTKVNNEPGIKWRDYITKKHLNSPIYGLGLAHGVPSVVMILLKIFHAGICQEQIAALVGQSLTWIISTKFENGMQKSVYPNMILNDDKGSFSRLSWCYGDLGLAIMFYYAGITFKNDLWIQESDSLIKHALPRREPLEDPTLDPGVCHGTAGIAFLFKILGAISSNEACYQAQAFWMSQTLKFANTNGGPSFKFYYPATGADSWVEKMGVLEGSAGVGLVLLDYLNDNAYPSVLKDALLLKL